MYLSCLLIDTGTNPDRPRPGRTWLRQPYRIHQRLCMGFPEEASKAADPEFLKPYEPARFHGVHEKTRTAEHAFLYRVDPLPGGRAMVVVQSAPCPDWTYAFQNAMHLLVGPPDVKPVEYCYASGQTLVFRLRANPTRRDNHTKKREGVLTEDKQRKWLERKGREGGFEVLSVTITDESFKRAFRGHPGDDAEPMSHLAIRYDGVLRVTDPDAFRKTIIAGIGSGKAFGFGLLSVAPFRR